MFCKFPTDRMIKVLGPAGPHRAGKQVLENRESPRATRGHRQASKERSCVWLGWGLAGETIKCPLTGA